MEPLAITIRSTREALSLGTTKIYELIAEGELTVLKVGRKTLVTTESVRRLVERASTEGAV